VQAEKVSLFQQHSKRFANHCETEYSKNPSSTFTHALNLVVAKILTDLSIGSYLIVGGLRSPAALTLKLLS